MKDEFSELFRTALYIRLVEEKIVQLYPEQEMRCPVHLSIGQEAVAAGVCRALNREDVVVSTHRSHAHYLAKGGDLSKFFAELYGKETGCSKGKGGSMHLVDLDAGYLGSTPIVGNSIPIAVGYAWGIKMAGKKEVVVSFFGEGATEEGVFHESINFAKLKGLPILFVCENNLYSVYTPLKERQPDREIVKVVQGHGVEAHKIDGNDLFGVYGFAKIAVSRLREGHGPIFVEMPTYRWREHCGPNYDNHIGYRTEEEFLAWKDKDPIARAKAELLKLKYPINEIYLTKDINLRINDAVEYAKISRFMDKHEIFKDIYRK